MRVRANLGGGGNPIVIGTPSYIAANASSSPIAIDLSKKYLVVVSANYAGNYNFTDVFLVDRGTASVLYDSPNVGCNVTVSGSAITIQNQSGVASQSFIVLQLN